MPLLLRQASIRAASSPIKIAPTCGNLEQNKSCAVMQRIWMSLEYKTKAIWAGVWSKDGSSRTEVLSSLTPFTIAALDPITFFR